MTTHKHHTNNTLTSQVRNSPRANATSITRINHRANSHLKSLTLTHLPLPGSLFSRGHRGRAHTTHTEPCLSSRNLPLVSRSESNPPPESSIEPPVGRNREALLLYREAPLLYQGARSYSTISRCHPILYRAAPLLYRESRNPLTVLSPSSRRASAEAPMRPSAEPAACPLL